MTASSEMCSCDIRMMCFSGKSSTTHTAAVVHVVVSGRQRAPTHGACGVSQVESKLNCNTTSSSGGIMTPHQLLAEILLFYDDRSGRDKEPDRFLCVYGFVNGHQLLLKDPHDAHCHIFIFHPRHRWSSFKRLMIQKKLIV